METPEWYKISNMVWNVWSPGEDLAEQFRPLDPAATMSATVLELQLHSALLP